MLSSLIELGHSQNQQQSYYKINRRFSFWKTFDQLKKLKRLIISLLKTKNGNFKNGFRFKVFQKVQLLYFNLC